MCYNSPHGCLEGFDTSRLFPVCLSRCLRCLVGTFWRFFTNVPGVSLWARTTTAVLDGRTASDAIEYFVSGD